MSLHEVVETLIATKLHHPCLLRFQRYKHNDLGNEFRVPICVRHVLNGIRRKNTLLRVPAVSLRKCDLQALEAPAATENQQK